MNGHIRRLWGAGLASVVIAAALILCPVHFLLDDDYALMQILAGFRSGTPSFYNVYNNVLYSAPVSLLYRVWGSIPWYPLLEIAAILVSASAILARTLRAAQKQGRIWAALLAFLAVFCCAFLPNLIFLQYSTAAAALGAAAAVLLLSHERGDGAWKIVVLAVWSFLLRAETGYVTLFMLLTALLMRALKKPAETRPKPRVWIAVLLSFAIAAAALLIQKAVEQSADIRAYTAFNAARTAFMDYPHADFGAAAYLEAGWTRTFYELTQRWFFLDGRFNTEALEAINAAAPGVGRISLSAAVRAFLKALGATNMVRNLFVLLLGSSGALSLIRLFRRDWRGVLAALLPLGCLAGGGLALSMLGRFPQHAFYALGIPVSALLLYEWAGEQKGKLITRLISLALLFCALLIAVSSARHVYALSHSEEYAVQEARSAAIDAYAGAHPELIVVADYSVRGAGTPWTTARDAHPVNRFFWGGWYYKTPFYEEQLRAVGLDSLDADSFLSGEAVLLSNDEAVLETFTAYLAERGTPAAAECIERNDHFAAYRFAAEPVTAVP